MKIQTEAHGNVHVIVAHGPLVRDDVEDFRRTVETAMVGQGMRAVLDLSDVPYLDSVGIETIAELCDVSLSVHVRPKLAGADGYLSRSTRAHQCTRPCRGF
jgi:anti-anti-sigma factor